jgi:hypothetical protein
MSRLKIRFRDSHPASGRSTAAAKREPNPDVFYDGPKQQPVDLIRNTSDGPDQMIVDVLLRQQTSCWFSIYLLRRRCFMERETVTSPAASLSAGANACE